jgi:hypothetical protein
MIVSNTSLRPAGLSALLVASTLVPTPVAAQSSCLSIQSVDDRIACFEREAAAKRSSAPRQAAPSIAGQPSTYTAARGGVWSIQRSTDRISGKEQLSVTTISLRTEYSPHRDIGAATLGLICARGPAAGPTGYPTVMIAFSYPVASQKTAVVEYRFDAKPGRNARQFIMPNYTTALITERDEVRQFLSDMEGSQTVHVRINSITAMGGAEFAVANGREAVNTFLSECPMPGT